MVRALVVTVVVILSIIVHMIIVTEYKQNQQFISIRNQFNNDKKSKEGIVTPLPPLKFTPPNLPLDTHNGI